MNAAPGSRLQLHLDALGTTPEPNELNYLQTSITNALEDSTPHVQRPYPLSVASNFNTEVSPRLEIKSPTGLVIRMGIRSFSDLNLQSLLGPHPKFRSSNYEHERGICTKRTDAPSTGDGCRHETVASRAGTMYRR